MKKTLASALIALTLFAAVPAFAWDDGYYNNPYTSSSDREWEQKQEHEQEQWDA